LSFERDDFTKGIEMLISLYTLNLPNWNQSKEFKVSYFVTRSKIKNKTHYPAENCKGILRNNNIDEKICWSVPTERYIMVINSHSEEYLDICAFLKETPEYIYEQLRKKISDFGDDEPSAGARALIESIYKQVEDIPIIIAPTEKGWVEAYQNRILQPGEAILLVTSKNSKRKLKLDIKILDKPNTEGKIVELI